MGLEIPPLKLKMMLGSDPLKSIMLVQGLAVSPLASQRVISIFWMLPDVCEAAILRRPTPDL